MLARKSTAKAAPTRAVVSAPSGGLRISEPDDAFEKEADRVADAIMAGDRSALPWSFSRMSVAPPLQRKCTCSGSGAAGGECEECGKKEHMLQRKSLSPGRRGIEGEGGVPPVVHEVLRSPGQPLDLATRAFMESRFGHDFSQVRVHTDAKAAESAQAVNALAYTVGPHIAFSLGRYSPQSAAGRQLLAHELTHVAQQPSVGTSADVQSLGNADDRYEQEARAIAAQIMTTEPRRSVKGYRKSIHERYKAFNEKKKTKDEIVKEVLNRVYDTGTLKGKTVEQYYVDEYNRISGGK
jgi:hypothetical protein